MFPLRMISCGISLFDVADPGFSAPLSTGWHYSASPAAELCFELRPFLNANQHPQAGRGGLLVGVSSAGGVA